MAQFTIIVLVLMVALLDLEFYQLDAKTTIRHRKLKQDIHIAQPYGMAKGLRRSRE